MEGTYSCSAVLRAKPAGRLSPRLAALVRDCEKTEKFLRPINEKSLQCQVRGKFLYFSGKKLYLKSVSVNGPEKLYRQVGDLGVNVVWLANPTPERVQFFAGLQLKVVARLGLEGCLQALFAGEKGAEKKWQQEMMRTVAGLKEQACLLAYDLGAVVSEPLLRFFGAKSLQRRIRWAFQMVRQLDESRPITCTIDERFAQLELPFLDFISCQIDKSSLSDFRIALARLQNGAGDKPLLVHSLGVDSLLENEDEQAHSSAAQIQMAFFAGCAGFGVASFQDSNSAKRAPGLIDENGNKKPAFSAVTAAFSDCPFPAYLSYPKISVVICAYNGEEWIEECLDGCSRLDYPDFEVILIDDGSSDHTVALAEPKAKKYGFRIVRQMPNAGLSAARNLGMETARGEIIAYLDQDAFPDQHWLRYLAISFLSSNKAVVGGPNINPLSCGPIADCVDQAPGNSQIVMIEDELADHVPGCNLAVRRSFMQSIGGFDKKYRFGGDDVNFCWKVIKAGGTLGFSPGAMVWHYRRKSLTAYLRQQRGYGKGEAALEKDWPERFNSLGHQVLRTRSALQSKSSSLTRISSSAIYQTMNGTHSFLKLWLTVGPTMPEWPLVLGVFGTLSALGFIWNLYLIFAPVFVAGLIMWLASSLIAAWRAELRFPSIKSRLLVAYLQIAQPIARLQGRLQAGMTPWRSRCLNGFIFPRNSVMRMDLEEGRQGNSISASIERAIRARLLPAVPGNDETNWDWQIEGGIFGGVRLLVNVYDDIVFLRVAPYTGSLAWSMFVILSISLLISGVLQAGLLSGLFIALTVALGYACLRHAGEACAAVQPLLNETQYKSRSLWDKFQPPRHYFEEPARTVAASDSTNRDLRSRP